MYLINYLTNCRRQLANIGTTETIRAQQIVGERGEHVGEDHPHQMWHP